MKPMLCLMLVASFFGCAVDTGDASAPRQVARTRQNLRDNIIFDEQNFVCDDDQRQVLLDQTDAGYQLALDAYNAFHDNPGSERIQRWFGTLDLGSLYTILSILSNTVTTLESNALIYQCPSYPNCEYAQMVPPRNASPDTEQRNPFDYALIKWRPLFFADIANKYSQVENVYHEATHVAGSSDESDVCSGYQNAYDLAQNDPRSASYCAYNFQYFAMDAQVGPTPTGCANQGQTSD